MPPEILEKVKKVNEEVLRNARIREIEVHAVEELEVRFVDGRLVVTNDSITTETR